MSLLYFFIDSAALRESVNIAYLSAIIVCLFLVIHLIASRIAESSAAYTLDESASLSISFSPVDGIVRELFCLL